MLGLKLNHVSKRGHRVKQMLDCNTVLSWWPQNCQWNMRHGPHPFAICRFPYAFGTPRTLMYYGLTWPWKFTPVFKGHWQSPFTDLPGGNCAITWSGWCERQLESVCHLLDFTQWNYGYQNNIQHPYVKMQWPTMNNRFKTTTLCHLITIYDMILPVALYIID